MSRTAEQVILDCLDTSGRPRNPQSLFIGVRRAFLDGVNFHEMLGRNFNFTVPCRFVGRWEILSGRVDQVAEFYDGTLVHLIPDRDLLESWPRFLLWIPNFGSCGVLS